MHTVTASRADLKIHFAEDKPFVSLNFDEMVGVDLIPIVRLLSEVYFHTTNALECKAVK